ncbi:hypothetical protein LTR12_000356 [Friedmanniomyces endolithicus]|nr:hypothetical protein LTR74_007793 [Friedmanniomyces endolithicus]KAK1825554.1 hypothetical protein LTR12_000356 [Friedmanniomyces endolithicus]
MVDLPIPTFGQALYRGEQLPGVRELVSTAAMAHYDLYQRNFPVSHRQQIQRPGTPSSMASELSRNLSSIGSRSGKTKNTKEIAAERKNAGARATRKTESDIRCDVEDLLHACTGYEPSKLQSAGNGKAAGLVGDKRENALAEGGLMCAVLCKDLSFAFSQDQTEAPGTAFGEGPHVRAYREWARKSMQDSVAQGTVRSGAMFDASGVTRCDHDPGSKSCNLHHTPDFRYCRREHFSKTFVANLQRCDRKRHEPGPEQRGGKARKTVRGSCPT